MADNNGHHQQLHHLGLQRRQPHYASSAALLSEIVARRIDACLSPHAVTTLYYVVRKY